MRARARWGITPLLAAPAGAWALGLGDIELQSALNQPFRAEIELCPRRPMSCRACGRAGRRRDVCAPRPRSPGFPHQPRVSGRREAQRPQRRPGHVSGVDRRAVRDVARRGDLAARPQRCASTRCCSIRRYCCRLPRRRRRCSPRKRAPAAARPAARSIAPQRHRSAARRPPRQPGACAEPVARACDRACRARRRLAPRLPLRRRRRLRSRAARRDALGDRASVCVPMASRSIR